MDTQSRGPFTPARVILVGCGQAATSIHLPTIAGLDGRAVIVGALDPDRRARERVAARVPREIVLEESDLPSLIAATRPDIAVICSPPADHLTAIAACVDARVPVVLSEKPLVDSANALDALRSLAVTDTTLLVGAMHAFDTTAQQAISRMKKSGSGPYFVRSSIVIPHNAEFESWAAEHPLNRALPPAPRSDADRADSVRRRMLGLAVHDLPLVRRLVPDWRVARVESAHVLAPFGFRVVARTGSAVIQLDGSMRSTTRVDWRFEAVSARQALDIVFPPSYVHSGSSSAVFRESHETSILDPAPDNGYHEEWLAAINAVSDASPDDRREALKTAVDDAEFALTLADDAYRIALVGGVA